ncbi:MAG: DUF6783 domain-containing protein [Ruminococcus sp.]
MRAKSPTKWGVQIAGMIFSDTLYVIRKKFAACSNK